MCFRKGDHVFLALPTALLHGINNTRLPCVVVQEVKPQYYRLLCEDGLLEGTYCPGSLLRLVGATFSDALLQQAAAYVDGTIGSLTLRCVVQGLTGESQPVSLTDGLSILDTSRCMSVQGLMSTDALSLLQGKKALHHLLSSWTEGM